jgi:hypothetical protein
LARCGPGRRARPSSAVSSSSSDAVMIWSGTRPMIGHGRPARHVERARRDRSEMHRVPHPVGHRDRADLAHGPATLEDELGRDRPRSGGRGCRRGIPVRSPRGGRGRRRRLWRPSRPRPRAGGRGRRRHGRSR